jgi:hypothetical protein
VKIQEERNRRINELKTQQLLKNCVFRPQTNEQLPSFLRKERLKRKAEDEKAGLLGRRRMLSLPFLERQNKW